MLTLKGADYEKDRDFVLIKFLPGHFQESLDDIQTLLIVLRWRCVRRQSGTSETLDWLLAAILPP